MQMEEALSQPKRMKMPKKELETIHLKKAEGGGAVAEHHFTNYEHKPETHVFGADEGGKLAAHIGQHMGMKMGALPAEADGENEGTEDEE